MGEGVEGRQAGENPQADPDHASEYNGEIECPPKEWDIMKAQSVQHKCDRDGELAVRVVRVNLHLSLNPTPNFCNWMASYLWLLLHRSVVLMYI